MNEVYDIFIVSAKKDFIKLPYLLKSIEENLEGYDQIYICTPDNSEFVSNWKNVNFIKERDVLDLSSYIFNYRPNWIGQQFRKLFQTLTKDLFLTVDADVIFNRRMPMFNNNGLPIMYGGWSQYHRPYFEFQEKLFNLPRPVNFPYTFINDMNFMRKSVIREMLDRYGLSVDSFIKETCKLLKGPQGAPDACYIAEPELYGCYMLKYHKDEFEFRQAKTHSEGRIVNSIEEIAWSNSDIEEKIKCFKDLDYDQIMLHSWYNDSTNRMI